MEPKTAVVWGTSFTGIGDKREELPRSSSLYSLGCCIGIASNFSHVNGGVQTVQQHIGTGGSRRPTQRKTHDSTDVNPVYPHHSE